MGRRPQRYVWVTGTWRVPPPGRFWVNGYWKRDDQGWYRVPGFWSERKTDRLDYRKNGPPQERPDDEPGEPPGSDCFYIPGQYYPDGDGVVWKKGFWTKAHPGWSWVPRSGSASPTAGCSRTVTGTAPSRIAAHSSPPPRSTRRRSPPKT